LAKEEDVVIFSKLQLEILFEVASIQLESRNISTTRKTTTMVYATCSIFQEENQDVARAFETSDIFKEMGYEPWPFEQEEEEEQISHGCSAFSHEMQLFPNVHETDGFYICRWKTK
jgi:16S rRNA C967 or C1407 C5-methylase (RsmB/RsmF family)